LSFTKNCPIHYRNNTKNIFIPKNPKDFREEDVFDYLQNLEIEINNGLFTKNELLLLQKDALYGKFLDKLRSPFCLYHFLPLWVDSVHTLFRHNAHPKIIELGCGTGTSSLLFAMLGARVVGVEMNADLIGICNKLKHFYKKYIDPINAEFYQANTFDFPFENYEPIDAFFSLFAFNLMKPADTLLGRLTSSLRVGGKIVIIDGNQSNIYPHLIPSRGRPGVFTPLMMRKELEQRGFKISKIETHCAIPPSIFYFPRLQKLMLKIEEVIKPSVLYRFFSVSYTVVAEKL